LYFGSGTNAIGGISKACRDPVETRILGACNRWVDLLWTGAIRERNGTEQKRSDERNNSFFFSSSFLAGKRSVLKWQVLSEVRTRDWAWDMRGCDLLASAHFSWNPIVFRLDSPFRCILGSIFVKLQMRYRWISPCSFAGSSDTARLCDGCWTTNRHSLNATYLQIFLVRSWLWC
jgi:hypothetical protein